MKSICKYTTEDQLMCVIHNFIETKVVGDDESSFFKLFQDVKDHLGEVQAPQTVCKVWDLTKGGHRE